ncbi:MAG: FAD:protein FMN transferase [Candidatus Woesearchaeota archaeon]|nr:MAG: FAD:protein FMN transferase [Candidatus Woesearchaeota archaeon]
MESAFTFAKPLFGDVIEITLYDVDAILAELVVADAYVEALRLQKIFNLYDSASELSRLNTTRKLSCSQELLSVLQYAVTLGVLTDGLYDVSLGQLFLARKTGSAEPVLHCSYKDISLMGNTVQLTHADAHIDLGSVAKGYIVDQIVSFLKDRGIKSGLVNGRGDVRLFGSHNHSVAVQHPRNPEQIISSFVIHDKAVATSGDYRQFSGTPATSHLINNKWFASVSVIAPTLQEADAFATVISVLDAKKTEKLLKERPDLEVLTVDKKLRVSTYNLKLP